MNDTIEAKLSALGVPDSNLADAAEIFTSAGTVSDLEAEFRNRHYTCDVEQYLCPRFRVLYERSLEVREAINGELSSLGVPVDTVRAYFTEFGDQPYMTFHFQHQEIPLEVREKVIAKAQDLMLNSLRKHLGLTEGRPIQN